MMYRLIIVYIIFLSFNFALSAESVLVSTTDLDRFNRSWPRLAITEERSLKLLIEKLSTSNVGKELLLKAQKKAKYSGETLLDVILPGSSSLTDTTLIRKFSPSSPDAIVYISKSKVYVNRHLNPVDGILDIAHELTHYIFRQPFNPYQVNFSLTEFITSTIEGKGGEVDAFLNECKVLKELFPHVASRRGTCSKIQARGGKFSKDLAINEFYKIGRDFNTFSKILTKNKEGSFILGRVTSDSASFISSAYGHSYPYAAYQEYVSIMEKACANDENRLTMMNDRIKGRSPASIQERNQHKIFYTLRSSFTKRCRNFIDSEFVTLSFLW